jgi:hypothetical protein
MPQVCLMKVNGLGVVVRSLDGAVVLMMSASAWLTISAHRAYDALRGPTSAWLRVMTNGVRHATKVKVDVIETRSVRVD